MRVKSAWPGGSRICMYTVAPLPYILCTGGAYYVLNMELLISKLFWGEGLYGKVGWVGGGGGEEYCVRCHFRALVMVIARLKIITYRTAPLKQQVEVQLNPDDMRDNAPPPPPLRIPSHFTFLFSMVSQQILYLTTCSSSLDSGFRDSMSANMVNQTL